MKRILSIFTVLFLFTSITHGQTNGKLQMHFIDVGQGDAAVLISPKGEVVMFDNGDAGHCTLPVSYLEQLGITKIDYHIASHYHDDHIGCTTDVLGRFPLQKTAYDRGSSYSTQSFNKYITAIGDKRKTATVGEKIILDPAEANPVSIEFIAANGAGVSTTNENDLSVVAVVRFGTLDLVMGGDVSGFKDSSYEDIETPIANGVGQVEVYKVHHHGSAYSSNDYWLSIIKPKVGIISAGNGNSYNHPTLACLDRLHNAGVKTYWTESGAGAAANPQWDLIGGNIIVEIAPNSDRFTVAYNNSSQTETYPTWNAKALSDNSYSPRSTTCTANGCTGTITVEMLPGDSAWTAVSSDAWITVTSGGGGAGNSMVGYSVTLNNGFARTGTITIGGQTFTITQNASGYNLKGDINNDGNVTLTDAILVLQVMTGMQPQGLRSDYPTSDTDVNGDGRVGMPELLYILQEVAGVRVETPSTYSIIGIITAGGASLSHVTVALSGMTSATTTTDTNGNYVFTGLANGNYTITPSKEGYVFIPLTATVNGANISDSNFILLLSCKDWDEMLIGSAYRLVNNVWGKGDITNYSQCIFTQMSTFFSSPRSGWQWSWPSTAGGVKSYPEYIFGFSPWALKSTTSLLPDNVASVLQKAMILSYNADMKVNGSYNLSADIWLTSTNPPSPQSRKHEIMIWSDYSGMNPNGVKVKSFTLDGTTWDLYVGTGSDDTASWQYIAILTQNKPLLSATINISNILSQLISEGYIQGNEVVASVEFGTEIKNGDGKIVFSDYSIQEQKQ